MNWKKSFFTIAAGQTISLVGSSAVQFAMIWWLASETSSAIMLAFAGLVAYLPIFFLSPFAGVWVDRMERKKVVIVADLFMGFVAALFALWFLAGSPPYWSVCLVLFVRSIGGVFHTPAIQSVIPSIVPSDQLVRANGWSQFMQSGAFMLGPVLGGVMYGLFPMYVILVSDLAGALAASASMAITPIHEPAHDQNQTPHFLRELREGAAVFQENKVLLAFLLSTAVCMVCYMPLSSLYPLMTSDYFRLDAIHGSMVELCYAGGMMGVSLLMGVAGAGGNRIRLIHMGLWGLGLSSLLCGFLPATKTGFWLFAAFCMTMGASANFYGIPIMAYMQETIPQERMGRAFSLWAMVMSAAMPLGLLLSGPVAQRFGVKNWFLATGIVILAVTTVNYMAVSRINLGRNRL